MYRTALMGLADWLDLSSIKTLSQHASATLAAFVCFIVVGYTVKWAPLSDTARAILEFVEQVVLIGLVVWFVWQTALVLWKGRVRNGFKDSVVVF